MGSFLYLSQRLLWSFYEAMEGQAMEIRPITVGDVVAKLDAGEVFTFSRWGDGEWQSVLGRTRWHNCDYHSYYPRMGDKLRDVLLSRPKYLLGMQPLALTLFEDKIVKWLTDNCLTELDWVPADIFHDASKDGLLGPLIATLNSKPLVVVGPPHLQRAKAVLSWRAFVDVPPRNAYLALDDIYRNTLAALEDMPKHSIVSVSAGMPAKILVHLLHKRAGTRHTIIDVGALFDPYAGVISRSYMRGMEVYDGPKEGRCA
jgi:hypothetical protein